MILTILMGVVVVIGIILAVAASRPSEFRVSRSATINVPPTVAFGFVNDLHRWEAWSPWAKMDPNCKMVYDGAPAGTGAGYAWDGNKNVGAGRMKITESRAPELIRLQLDFLKPFRGTNQVEFTFEPVGSQTRVTWTMAGKYNFLVKVIGLFVNCEKMMGTQFQTGLTSLTQIAEAESKRA